MSHLVSHLASSGLVFAIGASLEIRQKVIAASYELLGLAPLVEVKKSTLVYNTDLFPAGDV